MDIFVFYLAVFCCVGTLALANSLHLVPITTITQCQFVPENVVYCITTYLFYMFQISRVSKCFVLPIKMLFFGITRVHFLMSVLS